MQGLLWLRLRDLLRVSTLPRRLRRYRDLNLVLRYHHWRLQYLYPGWSSAFRCRDWNSARRYRRRRSQSAGQG